MKRILASVLMLSMITAVFTGCSDDGEASTSSTTEKEVVRVQLIGNFTEEDSLDPLTGETIEGVSVLEKAFEAQNENIDLEFILMGWDDYNKKTQAMILANEVDVVQVPGIASMASMDVLEPLQPYIDRDGFDLTKYIAGQVEGWQVMAPNDTEPTTYALPWIADTRFMMYDKKIFDEWGVEYLSQNPTMEEVLEKASQMTGINPVTGEQNYGVYFKGKDITDAAMNVAEGLGGSWGTGIKFDELEFDLNSEELIEASNLMHEMTQYMPEGFITGAGGEKFSRADNDIAILFRASPGYVANIESIGISDQYDVSNLFVNPETGTGGLFAGSPFAITKNSEAKDASWEFLKFTQTKEWQEFMWVNYDCLPTTIEGSTFEGLDTPLYAEVVDTIQYLWTPRYPFDSTSVRGIFKTGLESIVASGEDAKTILDGVQADAEKWVSEQ